MSCDEPALPIAIFDVRKVSALIDAAPGMVFACLRRADGAVAMPFASSRIDELLGASAQEVELDATPLVQRLHPQDRRRVERSLSVSARRGRRWRREFRFRHPDGAWRWLEAHAAPQAQADGSIIWYGYLQDIADRKAAQARLRDGQALLRQRALQAVAREAQEARHAARRLISRLAADLAGPVQVLQSWADVGTPQAARALKPAADRLLQLQADLGELMLLAAGTLTPQRSAVDLAAVVADAVEAVRPLAQAAGVTLSLAAVPAAAAVHADGARLQRVLRALLERSIDACRDPGRVGVEVIAVDGLAPAWALQVHDNAPLSAAVAAALLSSGSADGQAGGDVPADIEPPLPLGLALAAALVPLMGGRLSVLPPRATGAGTTVALTLPAAVSQAAALPTAAATGGGDVLYIEDNPVNVVLVEQILSRCPGVALHSAGTGAEGLALARRLRPRLVLLDMQLPDMSGIEVAQALAASEELGRTPIVGLSADTWAEARGNPAAFGLRSYLTKPVDMHDLLRTVNEVLAA